MGGREKIFKKILVKIDIWGILNSSGQMEMRLGQGAYSHKA
jgi:hypothetical protein